MNPPARTGRELRILHLVSDTDRRGGQVFATDLHHALTDRTVKSSIYAIQPGRKGGLEIPVLGNRRFGIQATRLLRRQMSNVDVTVAHGSTSVLACRIAGGGPARPFVVRQISEARYWLDTRAKRGRMRWYLQGSDRVVSLSQSSAQELTDLTGLDESLHAVIPNGVPLGHFRPPSQAERSTARSQFSIGQDQSVFCYVGALVPEKGVDLLVRSIGQIKDAMLIVAGDGPDRRALEDLAIREAPHRIQFVGSLGNPLPVYHASDALLLASRGGDSMPAVIAEAAFCGLPTIATNVGAIGEMVDDGSTGVVIERDDYRGFSEAVRSATESSTATHHMGDRAMARCIESFEINPVADLWLDLLTDVAMAASGTRQGTNIR